MANNAFNIENSHEIKGKFIVFFGFSIAITVLFSVITGIILLSYVINKTNSNMLQSEIINISRMVEDLYSSLNTSKVAVDESDINGAKDSLKEYLKDYKFGDTGFVTIVDNENKDVVYSSGFKDDFIDNIPYSNELVIDDFSYMGKKYFLSYFTDYNFNWTIYLAVDHDEIYNSFWFYIVVIFVVSIVLIIIAIIFSSIIATKLMNKMKISSMATTDSFLEKNELQGEISVRENLNINRLSDNFNFTLRYLKDIISNKFRNNAIDQNSLMEINQLSLELNYSFHKIIVLLGSKGRDIPQEKVNYERMPTSKHSKIINSDMVEKARISNTKNISSAKSVSSANDTIQATQVLDARNFKCPMPIIKISQVLSKLGSGDILEVIATDPAFEGDVQAWCYKTKNELVSFEKEPKYYKAIIRRKILDSKF